MEVGVKREKRLLQRLAVISFDADQKPLLVLFIPWKIAVRVRGRGKLGEKEHKPGQLLTLPGGVVFRA